MPIIADAILGPPIHLRFAAMKGPHPYGQGRRNPKTTILKKKKVMVIFDVIPGLTRNLYGEFLTQGPVLGLFSGLGVLQKWSGPVSPLESGPWVEN